jgi:hypothetical protein
MSAKAQFYMQSASSMFFTFASVIQVVSREWRSAGLFAAAAVVYLIGAFFSRRKITGY